MAGNSLDLQFSSRDDLATQISNLYDAWRDLKQPVEERWTEVRTFKYATSTRETTNSQVGGFSTDSKAQRGWSHSTVLPKLTQIADNLSANYMMGMFSRDAWVSWQGHDYDSVKAKKRKTLEAYVLTKSRLGGLRSEIQKCVDDWIETGNCFGLVEYVNKTSLDPFTGKQVLSYQGPVFRRLSPYDMVINPLASSFAASPKILKCLKSVGELIREAEDNPALGYNQKILAKVRGIRTDVSVKDQQLLKKYDHLVATGYGSPSEYLKSGNVELLEFYGDLYCQTTGKFYKNHVITVVDRSWIVRMEPIKSLDGAPYIFHSGWRSRSESLWAMGPLENLVGMQYMINHLQNTKADAFDEIVVPSVFTAGDVELIGSKFGGQLAQHYRSDAADGQVQFLRPDATVLQADLQIQRLEDLMEAYAGSPREAMGIRTPGEKTAFEVDHLANMSARTFQNKLDHFSSFLEGIANAYVETAKIFLSTHDIVQTTDDDFGAVGFEQITAADLHSYGKMVPMGSRHFAEKARAAQTLAQINTVLSDDEKMHISSIDVVNAFVESTDMSYLVPVTPYIRLAERAKASELAGMLAQQQQQAEAGPTPDGLQAIPNAVPQG